LQGSLPIPILIDFTERIGLQFGCGLANFDLDNIRKQYHIVVISMPNTPITANIEQLNAEYNFVGEDGQILPEFYRNDFIDNYVARANSVLNFLLKQAWVNSEKVVIAGHSQGAKVATLLTKENPVISHVGLFGFNAFGRIDQQIRTIRKEVQKGTLNWE
jgi:pimeloyl-ACP methyl ester carboxylesterase